MTEIRTGADLPRDRDRYAGTLLAKPDSEHPDLVRARTPLSLRENARGSSDWRQPLPDAVVELASPAARTAHTRLVRRLVDAETGLAELNAKLAVAVEHDREAEDKAVNGDAKTLPKPTAPTVEAEIEEMRRTIGAATRSLPDTAAALVDSIKEEDVRGAVGRSHAETVARLDEATVLASRIGELVADAGRSEAVAAWCSIWLDRRWQLPGAAAHPQRLHGRMGRRPLDQSLAELETGLREVRQRHTGDEAGAAVR